LEDETVRGLSRDHVIAASLAGAVVVVVGYASGIGLRPGSVAATPPPQAEQGSQQSAPPAEPPSGLPPSDVQPVPLPAAPVAAPQPVLPALPPETMPGDISAQPVPSTESPTPTPPATTPPLPPPGTDVPACQPGVTQQVLDTVGGLPLLGAVTSGLGVTGPDGLTAAVLGYCRTPDGSLALVPTVQSGR
jgi:hypothetical protein